MARIGWIFAGLLVAVMGGIVLWFGGKDLVQACVSMTWPCVTGKVTESTVKHSVQRNYSSHRRGRAVDRYTPIVKYSYIVNGAEYSGNIIAFAMGSYGNVRGARAVADKYPSGAEVKIYHDPGNPGTSVLQAGNIIPSLIIVGLGLLFFALGIGAPFLIPNKSRSVREEKAAAQESTEEAESESFKF